MKWIRIITGDITSFEGDVIVNPTNSSPFLRGEGGLDAIITQKSGQVLLPKEELAVGEVVSSPSYNLTSIKAIYNTVAPRYKEDTWLEDKELLRSCYRNCMELLLKDGYKSIAFPLIGTGTFGCPKEEVLSLAVDEVNRFINEHKDECDNIKVVIYNYYKDNNLDE